MCCFYVLLVIMLLVFDNWTQISLKPPSGYPLNIYQNKQWLYPLLRGWSGGAMVLGKLPVPGRPTIWIIVGQGPIALAVGVGGGLFRHFYSPLSFLFSFSLSLGDGPI